MSEEKKPRDVLADALTRIELRETALLSWGVVDAAFTRAELVSLLGECLPAGECPDDILGELLETCLVVETPDGGYRSRMAETMRLLTTLRQSFPNRRWWEGAPLVLDQRFLHRPRSRPDRDITARQFLSRLEAVPAARRVAELLAPARLSGFQERATASILAALRSESDRGVMVSAGTGSGKSLAFYLPALSAIGESIERDSAHRVHSLALYPRNELLKDQFSALLRQVRELRQAKATTRPIVVGTWFGATPGSASMVTAGAVEGWKEFTSAGGTRGWRCPFLDCPYCGSAMIWPVADAKARRELLTCVSDDCGVTFGEDILNVTRDRASKRPADIMLTTTESLNRQLASPDRHLAFGIAGNRDRRVRMVLLDEVHIYDGTTGAQNAYLLRRLRRMVRRPLTWVGLSATLLSAELFLEQFVGLREGTVTVARPEPEELRESGAEYLVALRHDPVWRTGPLSTTIQTAMLMPRCLDHHPASGLFSDSPSSGGLFGSRTFAFTDKLDVTNRLYWNLLSAEGWRTPTFHEKRSPVTLAHLRAVEQNRRPPADQESPEDREPAGQWWWLPEDLGWNLEGDISLQVGRTSSQDAGVSEGADIVVATATLEVGYDDDRVGAILQHKAPHDASQFLQRRGRAGRDPAMRPWTVVVLSGWGRDRRAWQLYEDLFDPELKARSLPLGNRYVLRMQAVYALMDWLGGQLSGVGGGKSVWTDLVAPARLTERGEEARADRRSRQLSAAALLDEVLDGGLARERLRSYLREALRLGPADNQEAQNVLDALLWEPPRSLLLAVIPTIVRRLRSDWDGEPPADDDSQIRTRTPLREFVAGNLFDDLLVPDVEVILPAARAARTPEIEHLPALRTIRELMPGNVTRHFGVKSANRRHWVAPPRSPAAAPAQEIDVTGAYGGILTARFPDPGAPGREIFMYSPRRVALESPKEAGRDAVRDATTSTPAWGVRLDPLGTGRKVALARGQWQDVIAGLMVHTHGLGDGVRMRRFAAGATGALFLSKDPVPFEITFSAPDAPPAAAVALGIEMDVDGLCLTVRVPERFPAPTAQERCDRMRWLLTDNPDLPAGLTWFDRAPLTIALQLALADLNRPDPGEAFARLTDHELERRLGDALIRVNVVRVQDGQQPPNNPAVLDWLPDAAVLRAVRSAARVSGSDRDENWLSWLRTRFAATVGAVFVDALATACPEVDASQLALDIEPEGVTGPGHAKIWLTELTPGGTGQVEDLHAGLTREPGKFARILEASVIPGDIEELDTALRRFIELVGGWGDVRDAAERLRGSWQSGHQAVNSALDDLRVAVVAQGLELSRLAWTTISTRLLGAGAHADLPGALASWLATWDEAEARTGVALDSLVAGALIAETKEIAAVLNLPEDASRQHRSRAVANVLWPRGSAAWQDGADVATTFGSFPDLDIALVRGILGPTAPPLDITRWNDDVRDMVHQTLLRDARTVLRFPASAMRTARGAILDLQVHPVDAGHMLAYPSMVAMNQNARHIDVTFVLTEVEA